MYLETKKVPLIFFIHIYDESVFDPNLKALFIRLIATYIDMENINDLCEESYYTLYIQRVVSGSIYKLM